MQDITLTYTVNPFERLFIERSIELLYKNTIDSFRLRLHNPKTLIEELITVAQSSLSGVLTNNDYVVSTTKELTAALDEDNHGLVFNQVNIKYYLGILKKSDRSNYKLIIQSSKLILKDNPNYDENLFKEIYLLLKSYNSLLTPSNSLNIDAKTYYQTRKKIGDLTNHLFVELINNGYTKQYLYNTFQAIFVRKIVSGQTFDDKFITYKNLTQKPDEEYTIIFKIIGKAFQFSEFQKIDQAYNLINKKFRKSIERSTSAEINNFLESNKEENLISIEIFAKDYYKAIQIAIDKVSKDLDIFHLGFNKHFFKIDERCAVIGKNNPKKATTLPSNFQLDGYFRSDSNIFDTLLQKIKKIENNKIEPESYNKLLSAIRYYRTGSESPELETKLLNYWIGLEYIFTSFHSEEKTIDRIKNFFPKCHTLIYVKRNLFDYHKALERLSVHKTIVNYNNDLNYLLEHSTYKQIEQTTSSELLRFRTEFFRSWQEDPSRIQASFTKHQENLTLNITRLYRIRNEIVHNAAIKNEIYVHISHLKYYLTFILNSILEFMADNSVDLDNDGKITIDDYFIAQDIILGALKGNKLKEFLKINNPTQILY
ncbi:hypothetical protein QNI19_38130 [Cytophagaceae bacterium DM2B3-1]|uniref:Apea-like HEPN domain-containing protein n=1 Tax=Xanthocytophaga flava TaxID=3048013 RepID=A0ABT7CYF7_9BACT|nr:hypothetical protein [Xanthocytophaga flavus]MDJ1498811.1 hypothetical protein [Xanthocytophaga flavus]